MLLADAIEYTAEVVGLPSKTIDDLVRSQGGWRFTNNGEMYEYIDGSQREQFAEPDWSQPLIDGLRDRTFNVLDANFKPERRVGLHRSEHL